MKVPAVYLPEAEDDIVSAHEWYEKERVGLGDRFLESLIDAIDLIRDNPQLFGALRREVRAAPLRRFPYVVYYRLRQNDVLIIAIQHGRRSMRGWQGRE